MKKLIFGDKESIRYRDEIADYKRRKERRFKESGLSKEAFEIEEELRWWGVL